MPDNRKLLPRLDYLLAFETAALTGSFAAASREMNVSETAISRKVRLLEEHYNLRLFIRGHRSITLTAQGHELLATVRQSLGMLRDASKGLFAQQREHAVTLAATNSVAALWLMPRLHKLNRANSRVKIMLVASDNDDECLANNVDLSILRGEGDWEGYTSNLLFGETIFPVCSPDFLMANPGARSIENYSETDLIEVTSSHTEWSNWKTWMERVGSPDFSLERAALFNTYPLAIQAAVDGLGVVLGWQHLVDHLLESGALVKPLGDMNVRTQSGYYLLKSTDRSAFPEQDIVENWLLQASAARNRYVPRNA